MPRGPAKLSPELLIDKMEIHNERWLEEWKEAKKPSGRYYEILRRFLSFRDFVDRPFNTITDEDVFIFINEMLKGGYQEISRNAIISALGSFNDFLFGKYGTMFDEYLSHKLKILRDKVKTDRKKHIAERVNLTQLDAIRKYNKGNIQDEYIFEIFFQLGIQKGEFIICHPRNRNKKEGKFIYKEKGIPYNNKIRDLLEKLGNGENFVWNTYTLENYIERITKCLRDFEYNKDRNFNFSDIRESHNAYFFRCPICHRTFENTKENWVLAASDVNDECEYHLVCAVCKGSSNEDQSY